MKLYMAVTRDKYELPLVVTDSIAELARWSGKSYDNVASCISHGRTGKKLGFKFIRIEIEEGELSELPREMECDSDSKMPLLSKG